MEDTNGEAAEGTEVGDPKGSTADHTDVLEGKSSKCMSCGR